MSEILGNGLAFPLQADHRGALALVSGEDDIHQALEIILSTAIGERPMRPEFGCEVHDYIFDVMDASTLGKIEDAVRNALDRWEPRIDVESIDFDLSETDDGRLVIDIAYHVRATNRKRNLVYPFYVIPAEDSE